MVKKHIGCRFSPSPVLVMDKFPHGESFFSPYGRNLLPCGKFNDIDDKHKQKSAINKLFTLWLEDLSHGERFLLYEREKSLPVRELFQDKYRARSEAVNPILFKFLH
jgi:hypothetical protein